MNQSKDVYDIVIIGGGLAGLTCALTLIRRGKRVRLLEKSHMLGGNQPYFKRKGFFFEPNIHSAAEAGEGGILSQTLASFAMKKPIPFIKLDPGACFIYPDQKIILPTQLDEYLALLKDMFPMESPGINSLFRTMAEIYEGLVVHQGNTPIISKYAGKVFKNIMDEFISHPLLQAVIAGFWGWGFPPTEVSGLIFSTLTYSLCEKGNFLPILGISNLVKLLEEEINEGGGEISLNSPVKKILIKEGKVYGVKLENGETIDASAVVSNADAITTLFHMVGEDQLPPDYVVGIKQLQPSLSAFNVFLGVKDRGTLLQGLAVNNMVYPGCDFHSQYEAIIQGNLEEAPYCITIPTIVNPSFAPEGHHALILYTPMPYRPGGEENWNWKEKKADYTERFINMAEQVVPGLKDHIVVMDASTPETLVRYTSNSQGAIGGWDYTPQTDMARPQNKTPIDGLWLAGHWTLPGPGIHSVIPSGCFTASQIP